MSKPHPSHEAEFWITLGPDRAMRIRACVFEEGLPTPHETDLMREPTLTESLTLLDKVPMEKISLTKPF
jgi:hypothetical protein